MNINDVFPSKYLKAADLKGHEPTVTIAKCEIEQMGDQHKLVLYFAGKEKGMICNRTNADRIAFMYSPDTDNWVGKDVTLYADMVTFQGKTMEGLRVKPPKKRNGGSIPAPLPHQQGRQFVSQDHGTFKSSTTQAVPPGQPDVDELPDDDPIPF